MKDFGSENIVLGKDLPDDSKGTVRFTSHQIAGVSGVTILPDIKKTEVDPIPSRNIFISHSSRNVDVAVQLQSFLVNMGLDRNDVFCSSIPGQGIEDGEQINTTIFQKIDTASQIIFLISQDFIASSYCMEELGVGWYRSVKENIKCYFLVLPDASLNDIHGFINKNIVKFTILSEDKREDLSTLVECICEHYGANIPKHSAITVEENQFWRNTKTIFSEMIEKHNAAKQEASKLSKLIGDNEDLKKKLQENVSRRANEEKSLCAKAEYSTICECFQFLGFSSSITKEKYSSFSKQYWFEMVHKYLDLQKVLNIEPDNESMEKLIACIYAYNQNYSEAYKHIKNFVSISIENNDSIYFDGFDNFLSGYPKTMASVITLLKNRLPDLRESYTLDSYKATIDKLTEREKQIKAKHT